MNLSDARYEVQCQQQEALLNLIKARRVGNGVQEATEDLARANQMLNIANAACNQVLDVDFEFDEGTMHRPAQRYEKVTFTDGYTIELSSVSDSWAVLGLVDQNSDRAEIAAWAASARSK